MLITSATYGDATQRTPGQFVDRMTAYAPPLLVESVLRLL